MMTYGLAVCLLALPAAAGQLEGYLVVAGSAGASIVAGGWVFVPEACCWPLNIPYCHAAKTAMTMIAITNRLLVFLPHARHMISSNKQRKRRGSRVLLEGRIVSRDGTTVIDVKIRDMSATCAILRVPLNLNLPEKLNLLVISDGKVYPAEKRWRKGERLVVKFVREPRLSAPRKGNMTV
jgi:hypothetical protein